MQHIGALTSVLERIVAISHEPADIEKLARIYRVWGRFDAEKKLLYANRQTMLSQAMAVRLGDYLSRDNKLDEAAAALEPVVDLPGIDRRDARTLLFDVLVRDGRAMEAAQRAAGWVRAGLEPSQQAIFVLTLAAAGADDAARSLAAALPSGPAGRSSLAWMLTSKGRVDLARAVVMQWEADADPGTALKAMRLYVDMASSLNSLRLVHQDLLEGLSSPDEEVAARATMLARAMYERFGYVAIVGIRPLLRPDLLVRQPLFAASLADEEQNPVAKRYFLVKTDLEHLDQDDASRWTSLAETSFTATEIADELGTRWRAGKLAPTLFAFFQTMAVRAGRPDPAFVRWKAPPVAKRTQQPKDKFG